jgi:hypothetical protein
MWHVYFVHVVKICRLLLWATFESWYIADLGQVWQVHRRLEILFIVIKFAELLCIYTWIFMKVEQFENINLVTVK